MKHFLRSGFLLMLFVALSAAVLAQRQIEVLNRGLIATRNGDNVLVSWRWLVTDPDDVAFNVYRNDVLLNSSPLVTSTNFVDVTSENGIYTVKTVVDGVEGDASESASVWDANYMDIQLQMPEGGTTLTGDSYTYSPNDASTGDLDGDGVYDIVLKWDPSNSKDNSQSGYTGNVYIDGYKLDGSHLWRIDLGINIRAGAHYTQFLVYDFDGDGKAELVCKTAPGTKDGTGNYLSEGPAAIDDDAADYRNSSGYILSGPEYLTVFNGETGAEMMTASYYPPRGTVSDWGDSYGNRVDRFLAAVAYLDGEHPSIVMTRGYYTRTVLAAWDWDGSDLSQRWVFDSDESGNSAYYGQGNHNLSVADVDSDGKDEIIFGSCAIDDDGTGLHSTGLGHGDALHVTDHDPSRPGLEIFMPHEHSGKGISYRDANTGAIIWQKKALGDIGRGVAGDISAEYPGSEFWAAGMGMYNMKGEKISNSAPAMNFLIWWDGDLLRELLDGTTISKYNGGTLLSASGCYSNNGTKSTPALQADLLGDWREEVIYRTSDNSKLRIYTTPYVTNYRFHTLMHDPVYRLAVAWQNVGYNQPPQVGFYMGDGMIDPTKMPVVQSDLVWKGNDDYTWQTGNGANWLANDGQSSVFTDGKGVLFSLSGNNMSDIDIIGDVSPSVVNVNSPIDYVFSGTGKLTGDMKLIKSGAGKLILTQPHDYTGSTEVSGGELNVDGILSDSKVFVDSYGMVSGSGSLQSGVSLAGAAVLNPGEVGQAGSLAIGNALSINDNSKVEFDLSADIADNNDQLIVDGDFQILSANCRFVINMMEGELAQGDYPLMVVSGNVSGDISSVSIDGVVGYSCVLKVEDGIILLQVEKPRPAESLIWDGSASNTWDLLTSDNWLNDGLSEVFSPGDTISFTDNGNTSVSLEGVLPVGQILFESSESYDLAGEGVLYGDGGLTVNGSGTLSLGKYHQFTGPTVINDGVLNVSFFNYGGKPSSIGAASKDPANLVINGGTLRYSGNMVNTDRGWTIGEKNAFIEVAESSSQLMLEGVTVGDTLVKTGAGRLILEGIKSHKVTVLKDGSISLFGDVASPGSKLIIEGGTFNCMDDSYSSNTMSWSIHVPEGKSGTLNLDSRGSYTGALTGSGTLNVNIPYVRSDLNGDWSAFTGTVKFNSSSSGTADLRFNNSKGLPNAFVNIDASIAAYNVSGSSLILGALTGSGTLAGALNYQIGAKGVDCEFDGSIAAGSLTKVGDGAFTLTSSNSYSGYTLVTDGLLLVKNNSGSATGTGGVTVREAGGIGGTGRIEGSLYVESGGKLYGGYYNSSSKLTVTGNVVMKTGSAYYTQVNGLFMSVSQTIAEGGFTAAGDLVVTLTGGTYSAGQSFKIIDSDNISGSFESISPEVPAEGLFWDLSDLYTLGILKVSDVPTALTPVSNKEFKLYPNPVEDVLNVNLSGLSEIVDVQLLDITGAIIFSRRYFSTDIITVDASHLSKGIYLVKVLMDGDVEVRKISKM